MHDLLIDVRFYTESDGATTTFYAVAKDTVGQSTISVVDAFLDLSGKIKEILYPTGGYDRPYYEPARGPDDNYVTDAEKVLISSISVTLSDLEDDMVALAVAL